MDERQSFTFYRSFYESLVNLPSTDRDAVTMAICAFALDGVAPDLSGVPAALFTLIRPVLSASRKKAANGQMGGTTEVNPKQTESKPQANRKQTESKREANVKQTASKPQANRKLDRDRDRVRSKEREDESIPPLPPDEPKVQWADNVTMTNAQHEKLLAAHGPADTTRLIEILDNYKGSTGKVYKDDYRTILSWCIDKLREEREKPRVSSRGPGVTAGIPDEESKQRTRDEWERTKRIMREQECKDG